MLETKDKRTEGPAVVASGDPSENIGGWLYLVAIGIMLSPMISLYDISKLVNTALQADWDLIWQQETVIVLTIIYEFLINGYMLIFSVFLLTLFFNTKKSFPKMFIIYTVSLFALGVLESMMVASIPNVARELLRDALELPVSAFIVGLIWIPYFLKSERVKRTFVVESDPNSAALPIADTPPAIEEDTVVKYDQQRGTYYVWTSKFFVQYMKYFKNRKDAEMFVENNPEKCVRLKKQ